MTSPSRGTRTSLILGFIAHHIVSIARAWTQVGCAILIAPVIYIYARITNTHKLQGRTTEDSNLLRGASLQFGAKEISSYRLSFRAVTAGLFSSAANKLKLSVSRSTLTIFAVVLVLAPLVTLSLGLFDSKDAQAATNEQINFQARLLTAGGGLVPDGNYNVQFTIYSGGDGELGGGDETLEWSGSHLNTNSDQVVVKNGYVSARLGSSVAQVNTLASVDWNDPTLWLSINIGNTGSGTPCTSAANFNSNCGGDGEMDPFMRFTSTPYAFNSSQLGGRTSDQFVQLDPGATPQVVNTANSAIAVNQQGAGNLIQLQDNGTNRFVITSGGAATLTGTLQVSGDATIQGGTMTIGTTTQLGGVSLYDGSGNTTTLQAGSTSGNLTFTLPTDYGSSNQCIVTTDGAGTLEIGSCAAGGLQAAYESVNTITTSNAEGDLNVNVDEDTDFNIDLIGNGSFVVKAASTTVLEVDPVKRVMITGSSALLGITGTITPSGGFFGTTTVTGVGTLFTSEVEVGDALVINDESRTVVSITDDLHLTVTRVYDNSVLDSSPEILPAMLSIRNNTSLVKFAVNDRSAIISSTSARTSAESSTGLTVAVTDTGNVTTGNDETVGGQFNVVRTGATGGNISSIGVLGSAQGDTGGTSTATGVLGRSYNADTNIGVQGYAVQVAAGAITESTGVSGLSIGYFSSGTIAQANGLKGGVGMDGTGVVTAGAGLRVVSAGVTGSGAITNNYGIYVENQTVGGTDYGIYVADAQNYSLYLASTDGDAASGITFGGDTNLYRSAADTLRTDDNLVVGQDLTVSSMAAIGSTATITAGQALRVSETYTATTGNTYGTYSSAVANPGSASDANTFGSYSRAITQSGSAVDMSSAQIYGMSSRAAYQGTNTLGFAYGNMNLVESNNSGTLNTARAIYGWVQQNGSGLIGSGIGLGARIDNTSTGTIGTASGLNVESAQNTGGGTITNNYGVFIQPQTAGTADYGIRVDTADTQTLWIGGTAAGDGGTANTGIAFGSTRDTNLYRSAANTLMTDDALTVGGIVTITSLGTADSNTLLCRNSSNQIATCTPGYDATVTLQDAYQNGNTISATDAEGDIALTVTEATSMTINVASTGTFQVQDSGTAVLTVSSGSATTITNADGGSDVALTVNGGASTGNILNIQDNATNVLSIADGGAVTLQNSADSSAGFRVMDADGGTPVLSVDTVNERVGIGIAAPVNKLEVFGSASIIGSAPSILTGSIDATASTSVVGTGTLFLSELRPGDRILVSGETRYVDYITDNTHLTVAYAFTDTLVDSSVDRIPAMFTSQNALGGFEFSVDHDVVNAERLQLSTMNGSDECYTIVGNTSCDAQLEVVNGVTTGTNSYGIFNTLYGLSSGTNAASNVGSYNLLLLGGTANYTSTTNAAVLGWANTSTTGGSHASLAGLQALVTAGGTTTVTNGYGLLVQSANVTSTITNNYGVFIQDQTGGTNDYGLAIAGADTYALWVGSGADNTDAANGITFGLSGDTNLYRSANNMLRTNDGLTVDLDATISGGDLTLGAASTTNGNLVLQNSTNAFAVTITAPNQTVGSATISLPDTAGVADTVCLYTLANCGSSSPITLQAAYVNGNTISATDAEGSVEITVTEATNFSVDITGSGEFMVLNGGSKVLRVTDDGSVGIGDETLVDTYISQGKLVVANTTTGNTSGIINYLEVTAITDSTTSYGMSNGINLTGTEDYTQGIGFFNSAYSTTSGAVDELIGIHTINSINLSTVGRSAGLYIAETELTGGGSIVEDYGLFVEPHYQGDYNYSARIDSSSTQTLWLSGDADSTTANAGIGFGSSLDTNLYRSAANTLRTDDAMSIGGLLTGQLGATISGAATSINASSNFATNINTGTSNGAVTIGGGSGTLGIDTLEFDVSSATGSVTIDDSGDAGQLSVEGSTLDINSLDFVGTGLITAASGNALTLQTTSANIALSAGTSGDIVLTTAAGETVTVATGNLQVGNGTPDVSLNGEDAYIEGTLEVDGAARFDGLVSLTTLGAADTDTLLCRNSSNQIATCNSAYDSSVTLQDAYANGNTISATDAEGDISLTVTEATSMIINVASTGTFQVQDSGTAVITVTNGSATTIANADGGADVALTVNGGASTGNSFEVQDGGTAVLSVADGGATILRNTTDSASGFKVMDADGGTSVLNVDTTDERVGIGTDTPGAVLDVSGAVVAATGSAVRVQATTTNNAGLAESGTYSQLTVSPSGASTMFYAGLAGTALSSSANLGAASLVGTSGSVTYSGTSSLGAGVGGLFSVQNTSTGTIASANGLGVASAVNSGGGVITNNYGISVQAQTAGASDFGIAIDTADTQTLWLRGDAGTANTGIGFGTANDTNLYRSAANNLRTNDALTVDGLLTGSLGATISGATTSINASSNFATNINTGTSTGAVNIGNAAAGAIAVQSASTIGLTGTTTVTGLTSGVALTVNNSTSTGAIFIAQDNGVAAFTIADGGGVTGTGTYTFSGVATDITTGTDEDLTIVANGNGQIILNDTVQVATLGTADTNTLLCRNSSNQIATCTPGYDASVTLQDAYANGNTISATDAEGDISLTVTEATSMIINVASTGTFQVQDSGTAVITVTNGSATTIANADGGSDVALTVNGGASTGDILNLQDNGSTILSVADGATTTLTQANAANGLVINSSNASQVSSSALRVTQTGTTTGFTGNFVEFTGSSTTGSGNTLSVTGVNTTAGNTLNVTNNAITTGDVVDLNHTTSVITSGAVLRVSSTSTDAFVSGGGLIDVSSNAAFTSASNAGLVNIRSSNASQVSGTLLNVVQSGVTTGYTGNVVAITGSSTTGAGNTLSVTGVNTTAGNTVNVTNNAITTGDTVDINHTTSVITTGAALRVSSTAANTFSAGGGLIDVLGSAAFTSTANAGLVNIRANSASQVSGTLLNVLQTGVTTGYTGNVVAITGSSTTGAGNTLSVTGVNTTAGNTANFTNNAITTGDILDINHTTSAITSGAALRVSSTAADAFTTGGLAVITSSGNFTSTANTAALLNVTASASAAGTVANIANSFATQTTSTLLNVVQTGTTTGYTGNVVNITGSGTTGAGNVLNVTGVNTTAGNTINVTNNAITTGDVVDLNHTTSAITTGAVLRVSSTSTDTFSSGGGLIDVSSNAAFTSTANAGLVNIRSSNASQVSGTLLNVLQSGVTTGYTGNVAAITGSSTTGAGNVLSVTSAGTTAGNAVNVTADALTTGDAVDINSTSTGITSGSLLKVTTATTGAVATNGIVSIAATGAYTSTSNAGLLNVNASATTAGTIVNIQGGALTTGTALNIAANSGNGIVVSTSGTDISSGTNENLAIAANGTGNLTLSGSTTTITNANGGADVALTVNGGTSTGNILDIQDNGSSVLTVADGGLLTAMGNVDLGDATSDTISFVGRIDTNLTPSTNNAVDLGETTLRWRALYAATSFNLGADGDDSTFTYNTTLDRTELDTGLEVERSIQVDGSPIEAILGDIDPSDSDTFSIFASTTVNATGSGGDTPAFTTEVSVGDILVVNGEYRTVVSITDSDTLVVNAVYKLAGNDTTPEIIPGGMTLQDSAGTAYMYSNQQTTGVVVNATSTVAGTSNALNVAISDTGASTGDDTTNGVAISVARSGATSGNIATNGAYILANGDTNGVHTVSGLNTLAINGDYVYGVQGNAWLGGSTAATEITGVMAGVGGLSGTANATQINGFRASINLAGGTSGTITDTAGLRVSSVADDGGYTFTNLYGVIVENQLEGNTNYGLYVDHAAGGTDYGLYIDDAEVSAIYVASTDYDAAAGITLAGGNVNLYASDASTLRTDDNLEFGEGADKTIDVQTRASNAAGRSLTIAAGAAGTGASPFSGGQLNLQGGAAAGTGNANGGNILLTGGSGVGTGVNGLVVLGTPTFQTATSQNCAGADCTITQANVDANGAVIVTFSSTGFEAAMPDPRQTTAGRIVYVNAALGSSDFTLCLNDVTAGGTYDGTCNTTTGNSISMRANTTATLIWNGSDWTAAGASSSTDLQAAYNNTLASAGTAELVLNAPGGAADGLTIRNNAASPISGALLEVQSSIGNNLFSVNNFGTEYAANGGAEDSSTFSTNWTLVGGASAPTRTTTAGQFATGVAAVSVGTSGANSGVRNNLATALTTSTTYQVSFSAKLASGTFSALDVQYSRDGGTDLEACTNYSTQTLSTTKWTKITCDITTDGTSPSNADLIIRQTDATARTIYIDNVSIRENSSTSTPPNVQIGGGINGGAVTLFTLDQASSPPVASGDSTYYGSMYYDTVTGRIQCYEADGWGACGSPPNNIITLTPEYAGAVLNGDGIGTMQADFCADQSTVLQINDTLCDTGEAVNYYQWTSPQASPQTYSIYVTFQLPTTFQQFYDDNTISLDARTTDTADASVNYEVFRSTGSAITECGSDTTVTSTNDTWQTVSHNGTEQSTCAFAGGDRVIFKINMTARNNDYVYASDINFTYTNE